MSFPRYARYKDSGVEWLGEVPEWWDVKPLFRIAIESDVSNIGMIEDNLLSLSYGRIVRKDINTNDGLLPDSFETYQIIRAGDIVFRLTDLQNDKRSLRTAISKETGIITSAYLAVTPNAILPSYLNYLLRAYDVQKVFYSMGGGLRQSLKFTEVRRLPILVPCTQEQHAIAAFLDRETAKIDALIGEQQRLIALLAEKRQATISHAVTKGLNPDAPMKDSGVEWLGEVPEGWEVGPLKRFWNVTDCKHVTAEFVEDGIPLASIREVQGRWVALEKAKCTTEYFYDLLIEGNRRPLPGDLIFSRNATVGEVAQVRADHPRFAMGQDVVLLRKLFPEYSSDYLQYVIRSPIIVHQLTNMMIGSTFKRINVEEIRTFLVPSPPKSEQDKIATFLENALESFDTLTTEAQHAITLLQERRSALISAAVTGKINVQGVA